MPRLTILLLVALTIFPAPALAAEPGDFTRLAAQISPHELMQTVRDLARFEGRQSGTPNGDAAAAYIKSRLSDAMLQSFPVRTAQIDTPVHVEIQAAGRSAPLHLGRDFLPIVSAAPVEKISAPIVFVGYGIVEPKQKLDEYAGTSVNGKIVLFLRGLPKGFAGRVTHADKVKAARARGAVAYLTVTGPLLSPYEQRRGMSTKPVLLYEGTHAEALPGLWLDPSAADTILKPAGLSLRSFQENMDQTLAARSSETGTSITIEMRPRLYDATASNVLAWWSGSDPAVGKETVILGAHHDHFGRQGGLVFPGADDNASGTAVLLEIARALSATGIRPRRSILFLSFAGEEQGLLGSRFYVSRPASPLQTVKAMVNVDHAGVGNGNITVGLSQIEKAVAQAAAAQAAMGDNLELFGLFPGGDHVPFAEAGIPTATIVTSGPHPDFHQPTDTPDTINPNLLAAVTRYTLALIWTLADEP
ncbi:MAG: M20/M25/M40 family metallo-hydrolase [Nitrospirota bacterium]